MAALLWFTKDLRLHDLPALHAALANHELVVPVFCLDERLLHGRHRSGPRTQFMLECLEDLNGSLGERGSGLVVRYGRPEQELASLAAQIGADEVYASADVGPFARSRLGRVADALASAGATLRARPGVNVLDDVAAPLTGSGEPYKVFSPFYRNWLRQPRREVLAAPAALPALPAGLDQGAVPTLAELGLEQEVTDPLRGGERRARERLERFLREGVWEYRSNHDALGSDKTSRLSPYFHFGCLAPREAEARLPAGEGPEAFRRQLCWRDFYHHVLRHFPRNATEEFQERYRGSIDWGHADEQFVAWTEGRTGFPLVDAGMRQLRHEGWMHNRARLVVGSFLTKDLGVDWRLGERWFMRLLVDGDEANNNGNWQWIASVGVDPQPAFRRIYNPARHMERFDPRGAYVRRYVPELRGVPHEYLAEPWTMPAELQEASGCVIGRDYPAPIVDRREARQEALARYRT
ncbi:MAG TPA: deoxyribodipyrimidine photo-lyase [Thermoleophilaceae bacterium]|nr:deoxyribodipyrimidine photo-lyase [Thermoleophilaceae bacterium]